MDEIGLATRLSCSGIGMAFGGDWWSFAGFGFVKIKMRL